ncbi:MAG: adenylate/guanylate cyclase domain-containing protein [Spirochaetota bacterium]
MSIRLKIILVVLPLLIVTILLVGFTSAYSARAGITRVAIEALGFKAQELQKYADNQWELLVTNDLAVDPDYLSVTRRAVESYAETLVRSGSELIFAVNADGRLEMSSRDLELTDPGEVDALARRAAAGSIGWQELVVADEPRVGQAFVFEPFGWYVLVTDTQDNFYAEVEAISVRTYYILGGALLLAVLLLLVFAGILTRPLSRMVRTMLTITQTNDLSERVAVEYRDEIGAMARTFNKMLAKLESANRQIRTFALSAVISQRNERKIRSMFQRYVPADVIKSVFDDPEMALMGRDESLAILFTDIRNFTTLSEGFNPYDLVSYLNRYFEPLVDIIVNHGGIVDKYVGDALMAFFGAPTWTGNEEVQSVLAALEMQQAIAEVNETHIREGRPVFKTGIGVNYGRVIVGNIGSPKKMDYTIIGDPVNYGSRLEGLTKAYRQDIIVSKSIFRKVKDHLPTRFLDFVQAKGKTIGQSIYTVKADLTQAEKQGWKVYHDGIRFFFGRRFDRARTHFRKVLEYIPSDWLSREYIQRCDRYIAAPPPEDWNGVNIMTTK